MLGFGNSDKEDRTQFIGFRGIGRISALPFCDRLTFINKSQNSKEVNICVWEGRKYREILNNRATSFTTFEEVITEIVDISKELSSDDEQIHYFKVIIDNYGYEIDEVLSSTSFKQKLKNLLPLKYSDEFTASERIISKYKEYMNEDLTDFMCSVFLDGDELRKNYTDERHLLDSSIVFWELRGKDGEKGQKGEKIGILWFTFNRKIIGSRNDTDYGIFVRSKNVLMGSNDIFADLCLDSKEHVATYSELTGTLRGVYGELLINSANLKDNARREWFKTDEHSIFLKYIIIDFMKRLYKYRYAASRYYRKSSIEKSVKQKQSIKDALVDLVDVNTNNLNISDFYNDEAKEATKNGEGSDDKKQYQYADEDMPRQSNTKKKLYEEFIEIVKQFFEKEEKYNLFLKLRAYIKRYYQE